MKKYLSAVSLALIGVFFATATFAAQTSAGCVVSSRISAADACITQKESDDNDEACKHMGCGALPQPLASDECYNNYGVCKKTGDGCGWEQTPQLTSCIKEKSTASQPNSNAVDLNKLTTGTNLKVAPFESLKK